MKKTSLITTALLAIMLLVVVQVEAQRGRGDGLRDNNFLTFLNLDESQQAQAETFYAEMQKTINPLRIEVQEKQLELEKLMISDEVDEKAVFSKVDEIGQLKVEMQKARVNNKIQLRSILTDDQKVKFDSREIRRDRGNKMGKGRGQGQCQGNKMSKPQKALK